MLEGFLSRANMKRAAAGPPGTHQIWKDLPFELHSIAIVATVGTGSLALVERLGFIFTNTAEKENGLTI